MFIQIYLSLRYCYYKLAVTSPFHSNHIHKHKNTSGAASVTVTVDLPKIYLFDVEINENIFQIKEKGKNQVGTFARINSAETTIREVEKNSYHKKCDIRCCVRSTKI